jgi:transposase
MSTIKRMMDTMNTDKKRSRRDYSRALKEQILAQCKAPGASVAKVAMAHGINANIVHTWRKLARERVTEPVVATTFMPLTIEPVAQVEPRVEIEVRRGAVSMTTSWPLSATAEMAAWAREVLR